MYFESLNTKSLQNIMPSRLTLEDVKTLFKKYNCHVLESNYKNTKSKLNIMCACGHNRTISLCVFKELVKLKKDGTDFNCKLCNRQYTTQKSVIQRSKILEKYLNQSMKYRNDFKPEHYNLELFCKYCNRTKNIWLFPNRKGNKLNKEKRCKSCTKDLLRKTREKHSIDKIIQRLLYSAKGRGKVFQLTTTDILKCIESQKNTCVYSGHPFVWMYNHPDKPSIDRIDSSQGYIPSNIQMVTKTVNQAKSVLSEQQFIQMIRDIYDTSCVPHQLPYNNTWKNEFEGNTHAKHILKISRSSTKTRNNKKRTKTSHSITHNDLEAMYSSQQNKCAYSHRELVWDKSKENSASIDRIDSTKGYKKDNVHLVTYHVNVAKNNLTHNDFLKLVKDIVEYTSL